MTLDELNKLVRDNIDDTISISKVIAYYPNAPRPAVDYCSVNIATLVRVGTIDKNYNTNADDLDEKVVMQYEAMVSCNFYRANARQNAALFAGFMHRNSVIDSFNIAGVGFSRASDVRDLTYLNDTEHEERAQVDLFLHFELTPVVELVTGIDTARVKGDIDNASIVVETVDLTIESAP